MSGRMFTVCLILLLSPPLTTSLFSQALIVSGLIRDQNTYEQLSSVNIYIKGTQIGTTSDFSGKYSLRISHPTDDMIIVFQHIAYVKEEILLITLRDLTHVNLQPRIIPLNAVQIEEEGIARLEIDKDLPQTVSVIEAKNFEIRGYVDAGDLLRTDHSVQVDEQLSGRKTVALRGGNADDILVLYNGIKLNNSFDNVFDLSLIDLENIKRFEVIKGSNTALYGPEAFSGVINVVPKVEQDYTIRFQQRFGTYRSGNWGLHFYKKAGRFSGAYSMKRGALKREFVEQPSSRAAELDNRSLHHTGNLNYVVSRDGAGRARSSLQGFWMYTSLDYENQFDSDTLANFNQLLSLKFAGDLLAIKNVEFSVAHKKLTEERNLLVRQDNQPRKDWPMVDRDIKDRVLSWNALKAFRFNVLDLLFSYQFEHNELNYLNKRDNFIDEAAMGLESADLQRQHHGFASILKYHGDARSDILRTIDLDISLRHDRVRDSQQNGVLRDGSETEFTETFEVFDSRKWNETMFKTAFEITGYRNDVLFNTYFNFGRNTKFPTLFQQINSPLFATSATRPNLSPERNGSFEIGATITRDIQGETSIYGWQFSGNYFQNQYDNKFRIFTIPGRPDAFYDNVKNAHISGFETKSTVFMFNKKLTVDLGVSKYFLSEKAAFPFKSDFKRIVNLAVDHAGYSFQVHWFKENEQTAWLRLNGSDLNNPNTINSAFAELSLPSVTNIDLHLSKTFTLGRFKFFANASGRNLLNDDVVLEGLAIRDRRVYLTVGAQY